MAENLLTDDVQQLFDKIERLENPSPEYEPLVAKLREECQFNLESFSALLDYCKHARSFDLVAAHHRAVLMLNMRLRIALTEARREKTHPRNSDDESWARINAAIDEILTGIPMHRERP